MSYRPVTFVDPATGEVLGTGFRAGTQPADVVDGNANPADSYWDGQQLQAYTPEQKAAKTAVPAHAARWDNTLMAWVDLRTLGQLQDDLWEQVKRDRETAFAVPLATPYGVFDADPLSRDNIDKSVALSDKAKERGLVSDVGFTLANNERITLTNEQIGTVGLLLGQQVNAAYDKADAMRTAIYAATTREDAIAAATW